MLIPRKSEILKSVKSDFFQYVVAYLRSVFLMSNKKVFSVDAVDPKVSLGYCSVRWVRFLTYSSLRGPEVIAH